MRKTYLVFVIQAYQEKVDTGHLIDACELQLIAKSYDEALRRAKEIIKKPYYRLNVVIEKYADK